MNAIALPLPRESPTWLFCESGWAVVPVPWSTVVTRQNCCCCCYTEVQREYARMRLQNSVGLNEVCCGEGERKVRQREVWGVRGICATWKELARSVFCLTWNSRERTTMVCLYSAWKSALQTGNSLSGCLWLR